MLAPRQYAPPIPTPAESAARVAAIVAELRARREASRPAYMPVQFTPTEPDDGDFLYLREPYGFVSAGYGDAL